MNFEFSCGCLARRSRPALGNHLWQSTMFASGRGSADAGVSQQSSEHSLLALACGVAEISVSVLSPDERRAATSRSSHAPDCATNAVAIVRRSSSSGSRSHAEIGGVRSRIQPRRPPRAHPATQYLPLLLVVWLDRDRSSVLAVWLARWHRISAIAKSATSASGRSRSCDRCATSGWRSRRSDKVEIVSTAATIEPGIFGIVRPVLLWPASMSRATHGSPHGVDRCA